jgi:hypothetical protein
MYAVRMLKIQSVYKFMRFLLISGITNGVFVEKWDRCAPQRNFTHPKGGCGNVIPKSTRESR